MIRIIDHKKVDLTDDEFAMYQNICKANDRPAFQGSSLFEEHFETNGEGIITFVKPPYKRYSSMEVYCFLVSLMINQHLRIVHAQTDSLVKEAENKFKELLNNIDNKIKEQVEARVAEQIKNIEKKCQNKKKTTKK